MQIKFTPNRAKEAHVLLMTLFIGGVAAVLLCAYLNVTLSQNHFTVRSQMWNVCMPVVEAGLEEALAHINNPGTTNFATQNWSYDSTNKAYTKQRVIGDSYCVVSIKTNA